MNKRINKATKKKQKTPNHDRTKKHELKTKSLTTIKVKEDMYCQRFN